MGDHKDDEKELDKNVPIASLTLGKAINIRLPAQMQFAQISFPP